MNDEAVDGDVDGNTDQDDDEDQPPTDYDVFQGYGVPVILRDSEAFNICKESLTRIGVAAKKENILYQSCHILHKRGLYIICHFKELFALDGKPSSLTDNDVARRNTITKLLEEWGLVKIVNPEDIGSNVAPLNQIKVLSYKDKQSWVLIAKYSIGKKTNRDIISE
jgi:hypothetical protein